MILSLVLNVCSIVPENDIIWKFVTDCGPHRGAFYERLNQSLEEPSKIFWSSKIELHRIVYYFD